MDKKHLIVFIGLKTTGKDYSSKPYIEKGFKKIALADSLRSMLWNILGYEPNTSFTYDDMKKTCLTAEKEVKLFKFIPSYKDVNITSFRKMLQNLGSTMKSMFGEDYWVKVWYNKVIEADCNVVCTDVRFPNEIKKALSLKNKGYNVDFIWCCWSGADFKDILKDTHESEALAQFIYWHQSEYNLADGTNISHKLLKKILKDFEEFQESKQKFKSNFN